MTAANRAQLIAAATILARIFKHEANQVSLDGLATTLIDAAEILKDRKVMGEMIDSYLASERGR